MPVISTAVEAAVRAAFPEAEPPPADVLFRASLSLYRPFEAEELRRELTGRKWTELSEEFVDTHPDWLVYLSPIAFRYYLPAWLLYSIDYPRAGYAADFVCSYLSGSEPGQPLPRHHREHLASLDERQRAAVVLWMTYLVEAHPDDDPGYLQQRGLTLESVRDDLESLAD